MKLNNNLIIPFAIIVIAVSLQYFKVKENFQGNTFDTLANLPSWLIYLIIVLIIIFVFMQMILQFFPWIYGIKTAGELGGKVVNGYFGKKNNTKIIPVTPMNGK